jgi:hypothetical protein
MKRPSESKLDGEPVAEAPVDDEPVDDEPDGEPEAGVEPAT